MKIYYPANRIMVAGITVVVAASACLSTVTDDAALTTTVSPTESSDGFGFVRVYTDKLKYDNLTENILLTVSNDTPKGITISASPSARVGEQTFRFYEITLAGGRRLYPTPGLLVPPFSVNPEVVIAAGNKIDIDISTFLVAYSEWQVPLTGTFVAQIRYRSSASQSNNELVQYSNAFMIGETASPSNANILVHLLRHPFAFSVQNGSSAPLWIPSVCSMIHVLFAGSPYGDDGFLGLQRLTEEGAWQILRFEENDCSGTVEPVEIGAEQSIMIDATQWFPERLLNLPVGIYRWDVVFYLDEHGEGLNLVLREARHVLSESFEYDGQE